MICLAMVDSISDVGGVGIAESSSVGESIDIGLSLSLTLAIDSIVDARVGVAIDSTIVTDSTIDSVIEVGISLGITLAIDSDSVNAMAIDTRDHSLDKLNQVKFISQRPGTASALLLRPAQFRHVIHLLI